MESDRPPPTHRSITTSTSTHLFFCFTSSSSMKISSKSILSPGRAGSVRDPPQISLSKSVSRRLRNSRSIKGGASPAMFPVTGKKRGCGFDNPEPSSPKVTCIGQVRVKSKKKHAKNVRTLSRRRNAGDVNFRKLEHSRSQSQHLECLQGQRNNNQKWVHLPLTICETLKAFGSEVSCLFPCRSSCSSTTATEKEEKMDVGEEGSRLGSYSAMSARWLVALQDGDGGGGGGGGGQREIELLAGDDDDDEAMDLRNTRRHVFENLEIVNGDILGSKDEARVSICVPPKNALLLMRCRSDPMMMEALTNRFWEPAVEMHEVKEEDGESADYEGKIEENIIPQEHIQLQEDEKHMVLDEVNDQEHDDLQVDEVNDQEHDDLQEDEVNQELVEIDSKMEMEQTAQEEKPEMEVKQSTREEEDNEQSIEAIEEEEESMFLWSLFEENEYQAQEFENNEEDAQLDMEDARESFENEDIQETETGESNIEKVKLYEEQNEERVTEFAKRTEIPEEIHAETEVENGVLEREDEEREKSSKELPECLLLMMYEPKLSMEVSKETWVCSSDFIRRHSGRKKPPHPPPPPPPPPPPQPLFESMEGLDESKINPSAKEHDDYVTRMAPVQNQQISQQPARLSCSFPAPPTMAAMLEQKLVNNMGFEPMVLTRCKSEPMRTATAKLAPETCFWRNKLEPPRRASFGMAGLGF